TNSKRLRIIKRQPAKIVDAEHGCQTRKQDRCARQACQADILATTLPDFLLNELHRMYSMSSQNHITDWIICSSTRSGSVIEAKGGFLGPSCEVTMRKGPAIISVPRANQLNQRFGQSSCTFRA